MVARVVAESGAGSRMMSGKSPLLALGWSWSGGGLPCSFRSNPADLLSDGVRLWASEGRKGELGAAVLDAQRWRRSWTPFRILMRSPMLAMFISFSTGASSSRSRSPWISCTLKASAWAPHLMSTNHWAMWAWVHVLRNSENATPSGGSSILWPALWGLFEGERFVLWSLL